MSKLPLLLLTFAWLPFSAAAQTDSPAPEASTPACNVSDNWIRPTDFRLRASRELRGKYEDGKKFHLDPALARMNSGQFNLYVLSDLEFLLRRWPNHYQALQGLIRYEAGGGRTSSERSTACYFESAQQFAPDDVNVLILKGIYFHNKSDDDAAEAAWLNALRVDAGSPDAHYNLGLLYFDAGRSEDALMHATAAYESGYPLPGLKNKLVEAGQWETDPKQP